MVDESGTVVPVWTLAVGGTGQVPSLISGEAMTLERLGQLRTALAAFADSPIVTLEAHPLTSRVNRAGGISLDAASPLAQHLAHLVARTAESVPVVANVESAGEVLYRLVVPAKVAADVGIGLVRPMASRAIAGGVHSAMVGSAGIAAQATFVPVTAGAGATAAGAAGGAAGAAGAGVAGATALTVAAPLVLLAVAVGVSAHADHKRQLAIQHVAELLEKLHEDKLDAERNELDGCRDAIDKATAILLDRGQIGASLGLDSAAHAIGKAMTSAERRLSHWRDTLDGLPDSGIEVDALLKAFPGIDEEGGRFRAHLELAALAIALKRRVIVLQAMEHAQHDEKNPFDNFVRSLKADQKNVDALEGGVRSVLLRLGSLQLRSSSRLLDKLKPMTRGQVDDLLRTSYRLRALGDSVARGVDGDVVIDIARHSDGSIVVFPAEAA
jgi:hypothetical protein